MSDSPDARMPTEQLPIALFNGVVLAARTDDGLIWLVLRDLCATLGLSLAAQRRRINASDTLHLTQLRIRSERQIRTLDALLLDDIPLWLLGVQTQRLNADIQQRVAYIKTYLIGAVRAAFAQLTGLPDVPSNQIEDLRDLDRIEQALRGLEQLGSRQEAIEASQDRARGAFRGLAAQLADLRRQIAEIDELRSRVQELELHAKITLSPTQRGTIYQLVQAWGSAVAERKPDLRAGAAIRSCWRQLNARFSVSTYTDLPAARYDEAIDFIKQQYQALTGNAIDAVEQAGLDFEG